MANLTNVKIKDGFQSLLTTSETTSDPTTGTLQNGKGSPITSLTVSGALALTGDLTVDTSTLKVDSANNRVGIGTATPATKLHVKSGGYGEVARFHDPADSGISLIANASAGFNEFASSGNLPLLIAVNGSERARIDPSGNMGVGVAPSAWGANNPAIQMGGGNQSSFIGLNATAFGLNAYFDGTNWRYLQNGGAAALYSQAYAGGHAWRTAPSGTAGNAISFTTAMTLDASGNLGLGVTPSAWGSAYKALDVNTRGLSFAGGTESGAVSVNAYWNLDWKYAGTSTFRVSQYQQFDGAHTWYTAPSGTAGNTISFTQAMTLDASGNLGVGETSPGQRLVVKNTSAAPYVSIIAGDSSVMGILMGKASNTVDGQILYSNSTQVMQFVTASSESARINSSGNVGIGTTNPSTKLDVSTLNSSYTEPIMQYNGACRVFAGRITKAQGNTHTITIPFQSQSSQYSGAVVEVLFTASWTDAGATFAGRAIYALTTLNAMTNLAEIQDIGSGVSFAGAISGMDLIITATTTASAGQEPNRIGAYVKVVTSNPSVSASPTTMTLA